MAEYIEKHTLQAKLKRKKAGPANKRYTEGWNDAILMVKSMIHCEKAAYVAQVRHGRWLPYKIPIETRQIGWICNLCSGVVYDVSTGDTDWCPNCGAIMDVDDSAEIATDPDALDSVENLLKELTEWRKLGPLGAVQELVRAEAEGRVVVLPEKG